MITVIIHSFEYITVNIENLSLNWFIFHNWQCVIKTLKLQTMMENDPVSFYWLFIYLLLIICLFFCLCSVDRLSLGGSRRLRNIKKARDSELLETFVSFFYSCKRNSLCVQLNRTWFHNEWVDFDFFYLVVHHGIALKPVELIKGD